MGNAIIFAVGLLLCWRFQKGLSCKSNNLGEDEEDNAVVLEGNITITVKTSKRAILQRDSIASNSASRAEEEIVNWFTANDFVINYFTQCIKEKAGTIKLEYEMISMYVNFVINHDVWFPATQSMCLNAIDEKKCWKDKAFMLLETTSVYFCPFQQCLDAYLKENDNFIGSMPKVTGATGMCKPTQNNFQGFKIRNLGCVQAFDFAKCMTAEQDDSNYCDYFGDKRKFNFKSLQNFIINDRQKCRFTQRSDGSYFSEDCEVRSGTNKGVIMTKMIDLNSRNILWGGDYYDYENFIHPIPHYYNVHHTPFLNRPFNSGGKCFSTMMSEILSPTSYLQQAFKLCAVRQQSGDEHYRDTFGHCPSHSYYWTPWVDYSSPISNNGKDTETIDFYKTKYGNLFNWLNICSFPVAAKARSITGIPFSATGDYVTLTQRGLQCMYSSDKKCENYAVKFCCPIRRG